MRLAYHCKLTNVKGAARVINVEIESSDVFFSGKKFTTILTFTSVKQTFLHDSYDSEHLLFIFIKQSTGLYLKKTHQVFLIVHIKIILSRRNVLIYSNRWQNWSSIW